MTKVLLVEADPALRGLVEEWLSDDDWTIVEAHPDVVLVDLPAPREQGPGVIKRISNAHPHAPVVALSSSFFDGIESNGAIARALGVTSVLPKPLTRDALVAALRRALG